MRISKLALEAYGGFSGRSIDLRHGAALTVVYGANEAGKTTALKALTDLLFGIEVRSDYGWHHGLKAMSVAGCFVGQDGSEIAVRRLKRQARTLVDYVTNEPVADDVLQSFLRGRSRATFEEVFGLDRERLRAGGKRLMQGSGDLADSLVAASPGLANVLAVRDRLNAEAARFHNHQRKSGTTELAVATAARDAARRAVRELEVRADQVKAVHRDLDEADLARRQAVDTEAKARMEMARLDALGRAASEMSAYDRLVASRAALGAVPAVDRAALAATRATMQSVEEARRHHQGCANELSAAHDSLAAIVVDQALLDAAAAVEGLDERRAVVTHALEDVPKRRDEAATARGTLSRLASALGLSGSEELRRLLPGDPILARADRLVDGMMTVESSRDEATASSVRLEGVRTQVEAELARIGQVEDPSALRQRLEALDGCEERAEAAKRARSAATTEAKRLDTLVARLALGASDMVGLLSLPLPTVAQAEAVARRISNAEGDLQRARQAEMAAVVEENRSRAKVDALLAPGEVPTPAAVEAARRIRDATWAKLRPAVAAERPVLAEDALTAAALDDAIPNSDRLADERWAGSARAAELMQAEVSMGEATASAKGAAAVTAERQKLLDDLCDSWARLWCGCGVDVAEHADVVDRLRKAFDAMAQVDRLTGLREEQTARVGASDADGRHVDALAADLGVPADGALVGEIRAAIAARQSRFQERRDRERDLWNNAQAVADLKARRQAIDDQALSIEQEAAEILPALRIRKAAASGEAKAALAVWRDAKGLLPSLAQLEHRLDRIEEVKADFETDAKTLLRAVALDLAAGDAFVGIRTLRTRVETARRAESRAEDARLNLAQRQAACQRSAAKLGTVIDWYETIKAPFGAATDTELGPLLDRVEEALSIDDELRKARVRVDEALGNRPEAEVRADLGEHDAVALVGLRTTAEATANAASAGVAARIERHVLAQTALTAVESRAGAAAAAQDEQDAMATMAAAAEGFVRNHVAGRLLAAAVDKYRERHQSPIVSRASSAFTALTGGRWDGIAIDYGEEQPVLKPIRGGKPHDLKALSEGTADALYLALRVAAIAEHATASEPLPFVLDDLFAAFDGPRTEAGLELLADLGNTTQVILFTHHEHVVAGAQRRLADKVDVVWL